MNAYESKKLDIYEKQLEINRQMLDINKKHFELSKRMCNERILLDILNRRIHIAINYIDQVIGYKPSAREIDKELDTLVGILRGAKDENN